MNKLKRQLKAFTLIEMLICLLIISILLLLFVPNLASQKKSIDKKGNEAIVKVVETQIELYRIEYNENPTKEQLLEKNYVTNEQYKIYEKNKS